jgi:polyhydroxybutyrate depolymerase
MSRLLSALLAAVFCFTAPTVSFGVEPTELTLTVDDLARTAFVYAPAKPGDGPHPLVFDWHGHGGTARNSASKHAIHTYWPEAVVVYPQGVPTPGRLTDPEGKRNGWQHSAGDQGDRYLKFFDALLAKVKSDYKIDDKRIYSTGHSNGGGFTYLLWEQRGEVFAALGPVAAAALRVQGELKPKPLIHITGENDPLVKYEWQKITIERVKKLNGCEETGKPAGEFCTEFASSGGTPVVTFIHPGKHEYPDDAAKRIVQFFKEHAKN